MSGKLSIVIITKDTKELLKNLLVSIHADKFFLAHVLKTIVVDNASTDGTGESIAEEFPSVMYVRNEVNSGFARAVNKGAAIAEGDYVLFLNSDTILIEGEMEKMMAFMDQNENVAICGPQLVYPDMKFQRSYAAAPALVHFGGGATRNPKNDILPGVEVESLIGAAILVRKSDLEALHGFDERFFFFLEETDLCVRARNAGKEVVFFPDTRIIHLQGKTVRKTWIKGRLEYNISLYKFIRKHHGKVYFAVFAAVKFTKALCYIAIIPLPLFGKRLRIRYAYYLKLVLWHLRGCPENAGLRS